MQASRFRLYSKGLTRRRCLGCRTVVARWYTLCGQLPVARPARPSAPRLFGVSAPQFGVGASCVAGVGCSERPASPKNFSATVSDGPPRRPRARCRCKCVSCSSPCLRRQLLPSSSALGQRRPRLAPPRCARPRRRCSWAEPRGRLLTR